MKLTHIDRWWLLLGGCLVGLLVPRAISEEADSFTEPTAAVATVAAVFFLIYGVQRWFFESHTTATTSSSHGPPSRTEPAAGNCERFFHTLLDELDTQVCVLDVAGTIVKTNVAWNRFAGQAAAGRGSVGGGFADFCESADVYLGDGAESIRESVRSISSGSGIQTISSDHGVLLEGVEKTYRVSVKRINGGDQGAVMVTQQDLTEAIDSEQRLLLEKHRAETLAGKLEASQISLELATRGGEIGLWHWDVATGRFDFTNAEWLERLGCQDRSFGNEIEAFREMIHDDELVLWTQDDAASLALGEAYDRQFRLRLPDGSYRWVQVLGRATATHPNGSPKSLSGILMDIDDRKTAELRDAGMARIIEESINEIYVIDQKTLRFLEVNRGARENLGYSLEELREMTPLDVKLDGTEEEYAARIGALSSGKQSRLDFESTHVRRDGTTYPTVMSLQNSRLLGRGVYVAICTDMTKHRQLESQLAEARRLESIGELAAGVAHEMNTPLQFVGNNVSFLSDCSNALFEVIDLCQSHLNDDADPLSREQRRREIREVMKFNGFDRIRTEAPKAIVDSLEGIDRVLKIVRAMKEFTHPGDQIKASTDLNRALTSTTTVTRNRWKDTAEVDLQLDPSLPHVTCHGGALNQVFVNLIVNASDAIAERLEKSPGGPAGRIQVRTRPAGKDVLIEIEDNGCGMPKAIQRRVFDPFFTTKEVGKGTGQGLSLSHSIVTQKHQGTLTVQSKAGEGTIMRITLPVCDDLPAVHPTEPALPGVHS